jgi:phosphate transport system permease protein
LITPLGENRAHEKRRLIKDRLFAWVMGAGGLVVIAAITLIFLFLFYSVAPLFQSARIGIPTKFDVDGSVSPLYLSLDEYKEVGLKILDDGSYQFFYTSSGRVIESNSLNALSGMKMSSLAAGALTSNVVIIGSDDGRADVFKANYSISYPNDKRLVTPSLTRPFEGQELFIDEAGGAIRLITGQSIEDEITVLGVSENGSVNLVGSYRESSLLGETDAWVIERSTLPLDGSQISHLVMNSDQREVYVLFKNGTMELYDITDKTSPRLIDRVKVVEGAARPTALEYLSGGLSVVIGDDQGNLSHWFPVRGADEIIRLRKIREFIPMDTAVVGIAAEYDRKAFGVIDQEGNLSLYHATAERRVFSGTMGTGSISNGIKFSPRSDALVFRLENDSIGMVEVHNEHPEVSFSVLWQEVWYESRDKPLYIWQSSASNSDFEPKFSLTPLAYGTLKATFYSMLFAIPLAVLGAIYTAYFMSAGLRKIVKPSIEIMAALPTVILGFLAGLWLAPLIERYLPGFTMALLVMPMVVLAVAFTWAWLPARWKFIEMDGWESLFLVPILLAGAYFSFVIGEFIQIYFFDGSLTQWMATAWGITYDQRNSLVVGIAIGFAVIPTIFSISEDAVFGVPHSLTQGSLALGATRWQTALRVILLTASPGIFSAIMIGMGRAVGETMIVLMATGNTPIMDLNIFEGFRALSANIAVEMPEAEVASTHYRILFLAALVLFMVTFLVNTIAEVVRQRLRQKYSSL